MRIRVESLPGEPPPNVIRLLATDQPRCWWRVAHADGWVVVLGTHQPEHAPVVCESGAGVVFLGAEQAVFALSGEDGAVVRAVQDASDVRSLTRLSGGMILAEGGDQLLAFDAIGSLRWRQNLPDLVNEVGEQGSILVVTDMSGDEYRLSTDTGRPAR